MGKEKHSIRSALKIIWHVLTPLQKVLCLPLFVALLARPFAMLMPVQCIASVIAKLEGGVATIFGIALPASWGVEVVAVFSFALTFVFWLIGSTAYYALWITGGKITNQINDLALKWTLTPRKNMDIKMSKGEFCYLVKSSTDNIQNFIETIFISIIPPMATFILSVVYIGLIDWIVMLVILVVSIALIGCAYTRVFAERRPIVDQENWRGKINNLFLNSITNLPFISLFKSFSYERANLNTLNNNYYGNIKKRTYIQWTYWLVVMILEYGSMAAAVIIANRHAATGALEISAAVLLLGYILNVYDPIESLGYNISDMQQCAIKISRINLIKPSNADLIEQPVDKPKIDAIDKIEIKDISLHLGSFNLDNVSYTFKKGELIALSGPSGSGKTSVTQAILGLKEYANGKIIVNGKHQVSSLFFDENKISYALQEMQLFDKTLEENLLYPDLKLGDDTNGIIARLGVDKILEANAGKTEGLERTLSGGEKKRINIARAFIKPADLYVLDEPTNELDEKNVQEVLSILKEIKNNAIVIVISHDSRITDICDKVLYFN